MVVLHRLPQKQSGGGGTLTYPSWDYQRLAEDLVPNPVIQWNAVPLPTNFRAREDYRVYNPKRHFVGISSGCSFACSYCPHKIGAGDIVSRLPSEIISTVQELIDDQAETIIITGTDTAAYGRDINYSFPRLAHDILGIPNNFTKFHIAQFNPEGLFDELSTMIDCCSNKLVADIQLPIQTTSVRLLQLMNRKYSPEGVKGFIEKVREMNTELMFRTDLMVGFPTETENELEDTIDFAIQYFDEIAVYAFEYKHCVPLASLNLHIFPPQEIQRRQDYARERLKSAGKLVHSGGQDIESLLLSDNTKETLRK